MAKKKTNLEVTPIMGLSMMAIFVMMPVIFFAANNKNSTQKSYAAEQETQTEVMTEEPTPTPLPVY